MGVSSTQVGDHWGSARTVQPKIFASKYEQAGSIPCWAAPPVFHLSPGVPEAFASAPALSEVISPHSRCLDHGNPPCPPPLGVASLFACVPFFARGPSGRTNVSRLATSPEPSQPLPGVHSLCSPAGPNSLLRILAQLPCISPPPPPFNPCMSGRLALSHK